MLPVVEKRCIVRRRERMVAKRRRDDSAPTPQANYKASVWLDDDAAAMRLDYITVKIESNAATQRLSDLNRNAQVSATDRVLLATSYSVDITMDVTRRVPDTQTIAISIVESQRVVRIGLTGPAPRTDYAPRTDHAPMICPVCLDPLY